LSPSTYSTIRSERKSTGRAYIVASPSVVMVYEAIGWNSGFTVRQMRLSAPKPWFIRSSMREAGCFSVNATMSAVRRTASRMSPSVVVRDMRYPSSSASGSAAS
jgi:hypothetical protein